MDKHIFYSVNLQSKNNQATKIGKIPVYRAIGENQKYYTFSLVSCVEVLSKILSAELATKP